MGRLMISVTELEAVAKLFNFRFSVLYVESGNFCVAEQCVRLIYPTIIDKVVTGIST